MRKLSLCVIVVCLSLSSCGPKSKDLIVGKWKGKSQGVAGSILEITADGKMTKESHGETFPISYQWVDGDHIEQETDFGSGRKIKEKCKVTVTKDSLTLKNEQGTTYEYTREQ
jgi:hypothetical protein